VLDHCLKNDDSGSSKFCGIVGLFVAIVYLFSRLTHSILCSWVNFCYDGSVYFSACRISGDYGS